MASKLHVKKGDSVRVISGKDAGKQGRVLRVQPDAGRAVVEKINFVYRHQRPTQKQQKGGIVEKEGSIHVSNLMVVCSKCNRTSRVGRLVLADGSRVRTCRKCGEVLDK